MADTNFDTMKYTDLQKLAKSNGIKANMKIDKLIKALKEHHGQNSNNDNSIVSCTSSTQSLSEQESGKENSPKVKKTKGKRGRGKKKMEAEIITSEDEIKDEENEVKPVQTKKTRKTKKSKTDHVALTMKSPIVLPRKSSLTMPVMKKSTPSTVRSPALSKLSNSVTQKRKRTLSENKTSTQQNEKEKTIEEPTNKRQRKTSTPSSAKTTPQIIKTTPTQERKKLSSSPGVQCMIQAMEGLSSEQMKATLLDALDKKVQKKTSSQNSSAKGSPSGSNSQPTSNIPRFTAFIAKKNEEKKVASGTPDWKKIHKKEFSKWDSIDVYMEKKRQRAESLTCSLKKAKKLLKDTKSAVDRLRNTKSPKILKSVKADAARTSFQSPKVFKPSTVSTKNLNLKFGTSKTPATPKLNTARKAITPKPLKTTTVSKTITPAARAVSMTTPRSTNLKSSTGITPKPSNGPIKQLLNVNKSAITKPVKSASPKTAVVSKVSTAVKPVVSPRKANSENSLTSIQSLQKPARKSLADGLVKGATPNKFQGLLNTSMINSSLKKSNFDLKASLSKPLSWKPHKGKMKPLDLNTAYKMTDKTNFKTPQTQTIKDRRRVVAASRADKKFKAQMKKRGLSTS